jgi:hypothetical protein
MRASRIEEYREFAANRAAHLYRSACLLTSGDTHLAEDLVHAVGPCLPARQSRGLRPDRARPRVPTHRRRRSASERPVGELPDSALLSGDDPELRLALLGALDRLSPKDRAVVVLRYWEDRSIEETADAMNVSSAAVRTRSVRALTKLREQLGGSLVEFAAR